MNDRGTETEYECLNQLLMMLTMLTISKKKLITTVYMGITYTADISITMTTMEQMMKHINHPAVFLR